MRNIAFIGLVAASLAWAGAVRAAEEAKQEGREAAQATKEEAKEKAGAAREKAGEAAEATKEKTGEAAQATKEKTGQAAAATKEKTGQAAAATKEKASHAKERAQSIFEGKDNFEVEGTLSKVSKSSVTLQREELPAATLAVSKDTKVEVDGQQASVSQLKQGQDVKASFNLQGNRPVAVEIKAEPKDAAQRGPGSDPQGPQPKSP